MIFGVMQSTFFFYNVCAAALLCMAVAAVEVRRPSPFTLAMTFVQAFVNEVPDKCPFVFVHSHEIRRNAHT